MIPTGRQVALWTLPLLLAIVAIAVPAAVPAWLAANLVLLGLLVLDGVLNRGRIRVTRKVPVVAAVGQPFRVEVAVDNPGRRELQVRVQDEAPGETTGLPLELRLPAGHGQDHSYDVVLARRGRHVFEGFAVRWRSPLGFWEHQERIASEDAVRVYPDFQQLRTWGVASELAERQVPVRARRRPGGENEFQRLRPYVQGDAYRHIDWRATARRGEFVSREYGQESNQNVIFLLDSGRMMTGDHGGKTAFDHALDAALMMGQVALRKGDRVGLLAFDNEVRAWIPPKSGSRSGSALIRSTYDLFPSFEESDYTAAFRHLTARVRRRSLVVLLTTVIDEPNAAAAAKLTRVLGRRHLPLVVWLRDPALDRSLQDDDSYVRGAAAEIEGWRLEHLNRARRDGALLVDASAEALTPALLNRYLEIKARRLL